MNPGTTGFSVNNTQSFTTPVNAFSSLSGASSFNVSQPASNLTSPSRFGSISQSIAGPVLGGGNFGATSNTVFSNNPFSIPNITGSQGINQGGSGYGSLPYISQGTNQGISGSGRQPDIEGYSNEDPFPIKTGLYVGRWISWVNDEDSGTREEIGGQIELELYEIELLYDEDEDEDTPTAMQGLGEMTVSGWDFFENIVFDVRANAYLDTGSYKYKVTILAKFGEDQFLRITSSNVNPMDNIINGSFNLINKYDISHQGGFVEDLTYIN